MTGTGVLLWSGGRFRDDIVKSARPQVHIRRFLTDQDDAWWLNVPGEIPGCFSKKFTWVENVKASDAVQDETNSAVLKVTELAGKFTLVHN